MATKKVKKFGRGGDILTGLGAGLAGYGIYKALTKDKDKDDDYTRRVKEYGTKGRFPEEQSEEKAAPNQAEAAPKKADRYEPIDEAAKREAIKDNAPAYFGGNVGDKPGGGGNVGTRINTESPNSAASRDSNQLKSNIFADYTPQVRVQTAPQSTETVKGVNEKDLDRLQRRDVPSGRKKSAPAKKSSASNLVGREYMGFSKVGKGYEGLGKESKSVSRSLNDLGATKLPAKNTDKKEEPTKLPAKDTGKKEEPKKYGIGPYGVGADFHKSLVEPLDKAKESQDAYRKRQADLDAAKAKAKKDRMEKYAKDHPVVSKRSGGAIKKYAKGGSVKTAKPTMRSASSRADGIAIRGKTRA